MRRLIWLPIAGFLLIAGAAIAAAAVTPSVSPAQTALNDASPGPSSDTDARHGFGADLLDQVLADLVKAGTLTQAQADAVTNGLQQAITDRQTAIEQQRVLIEGFVADGVITQDEIDQLPADSPLRQAWDSIAKDGQVTLDQLRQLGPGFGPGRGHGFGPGFAPGGHGPWFHGPWDNGSGSDQTPQASPSTNGASS
jgi:hypothetical protein